MNEMNRIREIYKARDLGGKRDLYAWHTRRSETFI